MNRVCCIIKSIYPSTYIQFIHRFLLLHYAKGKAPVVSFHEIPSLYCYFEEIGIFEPIQKATEKTKKNQVLL